MRWSDWPVFEKAAFDQSWNALPYRRFKIAVPHEVTDLEIVDESCENRCIAQLGCKAQNGSYSLDECHREQKRNSSDRYRPFDPVNGKILKSFKLKYTCRPREQKTQKTAGFATQSVLANGQWHKMSIETDGLHRITPNYLQSNGLDLSNLSIQSIRVFGNGRNVAGRKRRCLDR